MENTRYSQIWPVIGAVLSFILCLSCITLPKNISKDWVPPVRHRTSAPVEAFALVQLKVDAKPMGCSGIDSDSVCAKIMSKLPPLSVSGSGSGMLVDSDLGPAVLTAAHVCENNLPDEFEHAGIKIDVITMTHITLKVPTKGTFNAKIIRLDREKDLCLLKPAIVFTNPVPISQVEPKMGDNVYTISAPYGISGTNMALIFRGFFSGKDKLDTSGRLVRFYTVPTKPGSSGSAVFNDKWEVVGVIHTAFKTLENVGMGVGLDDVKQFLFPVSAKSRKARLDL